LRTGGPASLVLCYMIIGIMLLFTCQALAEMAVLFPVNGAFFTYVVRFIDPSWYVLDRRQPKRDPFTYSRNRGFAVGWDYTLSWLVILPFELIAAGITIRYWNESINIGVWIAVFLVVLAFIQIFGVRGYGEVEFILSMIKIAACTGFIIVGVVIDCGGVGPRGYLGAKYWYEPGAFQNGFNGFAGVFVIAAFAFGGTELVGLAAAESANPARAIPMATKQVFWRIAFFYIVNLFIVGLIVPANDDRLIGSSGANTKASPFVLALEDAGIQVLPHIMNGVITIAVISVANSCTFGSTRTMQALAERGMGPKFLAYVDKHGRPIWCVVIQILFGPLAFIAESANSSTVFTWLLSLSGLSYFFIWGSICVAHIRFRAGWKAQGYTLDQIPYKPALGVYGSYIGAILNVLCLIATFYSSLYVSLTPSLLGYSPRLC
jgi:yeast amino acid transporter